MEMWALTVSRPRRIGASPKLRNTHAVALPPQPIVIAQIGPEIRRRRRMAPRVQREVMSVLVLQRGIPRVSQSQKDLVKRIAPRAAAGRNRSHGAATRAVPIDVVPQRPGHEYVDRRPRQELVGDVGVPL